MPTYMISGSGVGLDMIAWLRKTYAEKQPTPAPATPPDRPRRGRPPMVAHRTPKPKPATYTCIDCGKVLPVKCGQKALRCPPCRKAYHTKRTAELEHARRPGPQFVDRTCPGCGQVFTVNTWSQGAMRQYCTVRCRKAHEWRTLRSPNH